MFKHTLAPVIPSQEEMDNLLAKMVKDIALESIEAIGQFALSTIKNTISPFTDFFHDVIG